MLSLIVLMGLPVSCALARHDAPVDRDPTIAPRAKSAFSSVWMDNTVARDSECLFRGDRPVTRYEAVCAVYHLMETEKYDRLRLDMPVGALMKEFSPAAVIK